MTWWQTLLVAVVPAALTAAALLFQSARTEKTQTGRRFQMERREEMRAAHRDALAAAEAIEHESTMVGAAALAAIESHDHHPSFPPLPTEQIAAFQSAEAAVQLMCGKDSVRALRIYYAAAMRIAELARDAGRSRDALTAAFTESLKAQAAYLAAAQADLGIVPK